MSASRLTIRVWWTSAFSARMGEPDARAGTGHRAHLTSGKTFAGHTWKTSATSSMPLDAGDVYARGYLEAIDAKVIRNAGLRIVVDYAHSPAADVLADILDDLNVEVVPLNARSDPNKISLSPEEFRAGLRQLVRITRRAAGHQPGRAAGCGRRTHLRGRRHGHERTGPMMAAAMASLVFRPVPAAASPSRQTSRAFSSAWPNAMEAR